MRKILIINLTLLLTLSISALAFAQETSPVLPQIVLTQTEGVPDTLSLTLSLYGAVVGQIEGGQVVFAEPILETEKEEVKLAIQGEGRMVGARMIFEDFVLEPEPEEESEKVEELEPIKNESEIVEEKSDEPKGGGGTTPELIEGETEESEATEPEPEKIEEVGEAVEGEITEPKEIKTNENDEPEVGEPEIVKEEPESENTEEKETEVPETSESESTESVDSSTEETTEQK